MRQIVLDTETTGLSPEQGHRIIEIGCVELVNRRLTGRTYHQYLNPDREIDAGAIEVHGLTNEFLGDKPRFDDVAEDFVTFIEGAELVIHNAPFDVGFLDHEFGRLDPERPDTGSICGVLDTLDMARKMHPGQRNSLDALCQRYDVDNSRRELHGALLDARILAEVYLVMTGGQTALKLDSEAVASVEKIAVRGRVDRGGRTLVVVEATAEERAAHDAYLEGLASGGKCLWKDLGY